MKKDSSKTYFYWGLTAFGVIAASILFFFSLFKVSSLAGFLGKLLSALMPFIYGFVMAYLLNPIYNRLYGFFKPRFKGNKKADAIAKALATALSIVLLMLVVVLLVWLVLPQVITSVMGLIESNLLQDSIVSMTKWFEQTLQDNPALEETAEKVYSKAMEGLTNWIQKDMLPQLTNLMSGLVSTINIIKNLFIGIIVAIYTLSGKRRFTAQAKKLIYSIFGVRRGNAILYNLRFTHRVFGGFINGKLIDSLIIGILCFIGMVALRMPYAVLISVIVGVTNIIPFFGPFIGAIPSGLLILLIDPMKAFTFVIFILVLQQLDGNVIGPRILGESTGLSGFWTMFALLVAGGLFGIMGMLVGVPIFAVLYSLIAGCVCRGLDKRGLPTQTEAYDALDHFDETTRERVPYGKSEE